MQEGFDCLDADDQAFWLKSMQKLISTYSNDKLLRSKFSSPQRVSIFPVSPCEFFGHVLACGYALILESGGRSAIPLAPTRAEWRAD